MNTNQDFDVAPLIGVTTYAADETASVTLPANYIDSVRRAGGIPVLIAPGESRTHQLAARLDGIVLAGGGDICPSLYGGTSHDTVYMVNPERDRTELALAQYVLEHRIPTLAICRGTQIINVLLDGTLHPHLPDVVGESVLHVRHRGTPLSTRFLSKPILAPPKSCRQTRFRRCRGTIKPSIA